MEPLEIPITDELDLHTFLPAEVPDLLDHYFDRCLEKGFVSVRIIHGKGTGTLKRRVQAILSRHPLVAGFSQAPASAGGWGATLVALKAGPRSETR